MKVQVLTLSGQKYSNEAKEIMIRTREGDMVILPNHEPFTGIIEPSPLTIIDSHGNEDIFSVFGGIVDVESNGEVKVLVDEAEHADDLIEAEIEEAIHLAHELKAAAKDRDALHQAQTLIDRHRVRLNVVRVRRHKRR